MVDSSLIARTLALLENKSANPNKFEIIKKQELDEITKREWENSDEDKRVDKKNGYKDGTPADEKADIKMVKTINKAEKRGIHQPGKPRRGDSSLTKKYEAIAAHEEVESIDEVSKATLGRYMKVAHRGFNTAINKLTGSAKVNATEEVEAYINELAEQGLNEQQIIAEISAMKLKSDYAPKAIASKKAALASGDKSTFRKRTDGVEMARAKLYAQKYPESESKPKVNATEEVKPITEIFGFGKKKHADVKFDGPRWPSSHEANDWMSKKVEHAKKHDSKNAHNLFSPADGDYLPNAVHVGSSWKKEHEDHYKKLKKENPDLVARAKELTTGLAGRISLSRIGPLDDRHGMEIHHEETNSRTGQVDEMFDGPLFSAKELAFIDSVMQTEEAPTKRGRGRPKTGEEENPEIPSPVIQIKDAHQRRKVDSATGEYTLTHPVTQKEFKVSRADAVRHYDNYHRTEKPKDKLKHESDFLQKHAGDGRLSK